MRVSRRSFLKQSSALTLCSLSGKSAFGRLSRTDPPWLSAQISTFGSVPKMVVEDFSQKFDPAYLSNGLIGIRPGPNPLANSMTQVSGYVYSEIPHAVESLSPAPYPLETDLIVNEVSLLQRPDLLRVKRQALDMASGELQSEMVFAPGNTPALDVEVLQFASRSVPSLLCQEIRLHASADMEIELVPSVEIASAGGQVFSTEPPDRTQIDLVAGMTSGGQLSKLGVAVMIAKPEGLIRREELSRTELAVARHYRVRLIGGHTFRFQTIAAMISSLYHPEPMLEAIRLANWGAMLGFEELREKNHAAWDELWRSRLKVMAENDSQRVLDAAFFYVHSSLHPSTLTGMPPFGLSQHEHYYGHSFWDTESWSLLPVTLASPETGRALLEFRLRGLEWAKREAALYGYRGAQFPWEAAESSGFETTPTFAATGWAEQHVTPDVALGFWEYQLATGDQAFLRKGTWPVLKAVAQWIESRVVRTNRGFEIHHIMGPDEGVNNVNNDAYVNLICKMVLAAALRCGQMVGEAVGSLWAKIQSDLVLPIDKSTSVLRPYDNAPSGQAGFLDCLTVHDAPISPEILRNTYQHEETLRQAKPSFMIGFAADAVAATAAFLNDKHRAAELFDASWKSSWLKPFGMIREVPTQDYGCFLTDFGSLLQTVTLGFTGLRINEGDWQKYPAALPAGWSRIEIERIWVRGVPKRVVAVDGAPAKLLSS